jgi:hypothetical protein
VIDIDWKSAFSRHAFRLITFFLRLRRAAGSALARFFSPDAAVQGRRLERQGLFPYINPLKFRNSGPA